MPGQYARFELVNCGRWNYSIAGVAFLSRPVGRSPFLEVKCWVGGSEDNKQPQADRLETWKNDVTSRTPGSEARSPVILPSKLNQTFPGYFDPIFLFTRNEST